MSARSDTGGGLARVLSSSAGVLVFAGALVSFLGWVLDRPLLADWDRDGITIQPNAALAAIAVGAALVLPSRGARRATAVVGTLPALIGLTTLFEYASGKNLGIDTPLMFGRAWGQSTTVSPGRMGLPASTSFLLLGLAMLLATRGRVARRVAPLLAICVAVITLFSLNGYLFEAHPLYSTPWLSAIALQTSLMLFVASLGLIAATPEHEPMLTLSDDSGAGLLARRTLPFVLVLPPLLGWLRTRGEQAGMFDTGTGRALLVVSLTVFLMGVLWQAVRAVRQRDERRRIAEDALRETDRRKSEFLATLAHELRNPLAPIRNSITQLELTGSGDPDVVAARDMISRQVRHMSRLLDDLLDVNRLSRAKLELRKEPVGLAAILESALETARPAIESGRHWLEVSTPSEPILLFADPVRLCQVFGNLLNNAAKYMDPGGTIELGAVLEADHVIVSVRDTGIGIAPESLPGIFEMFSQLPSALELAQGGAGIGLSLAKGLIELHGGTITARSAGAGTGSTFVVRLPIVAGAHPPPAGNAEKAEKAEKATTRRILIADDLKDSADTLAMMLQTLGHEVHVVYDGESAVTASERLRPDVVLLDIGMPRLNGYDACRRIRALPGGGEILLIAQTGWGQDDDRRRAREAGFDHHMLKPVDFAALVLALERLAGPDYKLKGT